MAEIKLLGLSGSLRRASTNTKLVKEAIRLFGPADAKIGDFRMPLYDGDLEAESGTPEEAARLHADLLEAEAIVISVPEYNGGIPGNVKNALDWISRTPPRPMEGKPLAILSATSGRSGGARAQYGLRLALAAFRPIIVPAAEVAVAASGKAFDDDGRLIDAKAQEFLGDLMAVLRREAERFRA